MASVTKYILSTNKNLKKRIKLIFLQKKGEKKNNLDRHTRNTKDQAFFPPFFFSDQKHKKNQTRQNS